MKKETLAWTIAIVILLVMMWGIVVVLNSTPKKTVLHNQVVTPAPYTPVYPHTNGKE